MEMIGWNYVALSYFNEWLQDQLLVFEWRTSAGQWAAIPGLLNVLNLKQVFIILVSIWVTPIDGGL